MSTVMSGSGCAILNRDIMTELSLSPLATKRDEALIAIFPARALLYQALRMLKSARVEEVTIISRNMHMARNINHQPR